MLVYAIVPAAGKGLRMGEERPKQFAPLGGKPLITHTLGVFEGCPSICKVMVVVGQSMEEFCRREIIEKYGFQKAELLIPGGETRQDSVYCGLQAIPEEAQLVAVHDAVRPFLSRQLLEECIKGATEWGAAAPAIPLVDTIKYVNHEGLASGTVDRASLRAVQTPQIFRYHILLMAMNKARRDGFIGSDEATIVERAGYRVKLIEGSPFNIKVTTPSDVLLAETILRLNQFA